MEFRNKIKMRMALGALYLIIGIILIIISNLSIPQNEYGYTFGAVFAVMGLVRIVQYARLMKNPEALKTREIAETDERNLMLLTQARSLAFSTYISLAGTAVVVCYVLNQAAIGQIIAYCVCAYVAIYWIIYAIVRRKY